MYKEEFRKILISLNTFYGFEKIISPDRFSQWAGKVSDIPVEAGNFIQQKIEDTCDSLPRNLPKTMRGFYYEWKSQNAGKIIDYVSTDCAECKGRGFLWVRRPAIFDGSQIDTENGPIMESTVYRCGKCENWKKHCHHQAIPPLTAEDVKARGWVLLS